jgi:hypothetical protein
VAIDRDFPIVPPTLTVPGKTKIYVELDNMRWDEIVSFNTVLAQTAGPNLLADALTSLASPLSALQTAQHTGALDLDHVNVPPDFDATQDSIGSALEDVSKKVLAAGVQFSCLEAYKGFNATLVSCDSSVILTHDTAAAALDAALKAATAAALLPVPASHLLVLDTAIKNAQITCTTTDCDAIQSKENRLDGMLTAVVTAQIALQTVVRQMTPRKSGTPSTLIFSLTQPFMRTGTMTIVGTEFVTNTATTIGTFVINWQQTQFVLSTGVLGSGLANKTYAISSEIVNGVVQPDPNNPGKNLSQVTATSSQPTMDFPAVFGSWAIPIFNRAGWEYKCPGHCGVLLSGGVALNLTSKTADFAVGPSLQLFGVLITPSLVWGRQTVLADGITQGYAGFGSNPPTSLPTLTAWKRAFGIGLTYTLPTP